MAKVPAYAVALKKDIDAQGAALKEEIHALDRRMKKHFDDSVKHFDGVIRLFHDQQRGWKNRMKKEFSELTGIIAENNRKALFHDMKVLVEDIRHEYLGATKDKMSQHDDRLNAHQDRLVVPEERAGVL